jgi:hypothetical protein
MTNSPFARAGGLCTFHVLTTITVCHASKNRHKSNKTTKKKKMSCEIRLLGSGSWLRSIVIVLNVKPEKRDNMVTRDPPTSLIYPVYSFSSLVTLTPLKEISVKSDITTLGMCLGHNLIPQTQTTLYSSSPSLLLSYPPTILYRSQQTNTQTNRRTHAN